ncbi:MAG: sigma-70 family RNA polymerase sigma factor [Eubacteriales bacterium]|nr:sigma-70 family RNA polymerase sigma factor [Eubacteriales bacterium]
MSKQYHIKLNGELIPVSEEIYRTYKQPQWREKKRANVRRKREVSLDAMLENGDAIQFDLGQAFIDELVADKLLLDELFKALAELNIEECALIDELFFKEKSERQISEEIGIPRTTLEYRKNRVLHKLKKLIRKN